MLFQPFCFTINFSVSLLIKNILFRIVPVFANVYFRLAEGPQILNKRVVCDSKSGMRRGLLAPSVTHRIGVIRHQYIK